MNGAAFTDSTGNFWLFGGYGFDSVSAVGNLDDVWRYQPLANAVAAAATTTTLKSSQATITYGQPLTLSAKVTAGKGAPPNGETVDFFNGAQLLGSAPLASGAASITTSAITAGSDTLEAVYGGDVSLARSASAGLSQTIKKANTTTALTLSPNPGIIDAGQNVLVTVTGQFAGLPTGSVTFDNGANSFYSAPLSDGSYETSILLPVGNDPVTAVYSGDANFNSSTSPVVSDVVNKSPWNVYLNSSVNPAISGKVVTFTAYVGYFNGVPITGTVTFYNGTTKIGTGTLSYGVATFNTSLLPVGSNSITATYPGNAFLDACTSSVIQQVVNKASSSSATVASAP